MLIGRTNVPEFAAGSHTFNRVFGTTRNPRDPSRSAGGSSGGAAAALAAGMVPLADGSDMGGSLRNPASFCGVVGLRPSLGRVPSWPVDNQWETTSVSGPLARDVGDVALLLSVMAGPDPRVPLALGNPGHTFLPPLHGSLVGLKVGWTSDLGGLLEVDARVAAIVEEAGRTMVRAGAHVYAGHPDLGLADDTFRTLRAWTLPGRLRRAARASTPTASSRASPTTSGPASRSPAPTSPAPTRSAPRSSETMREFFTDYDVLALPVSQVPPFPAEEEYPPRSTARPWPTTSSWMRSAYLISVTGCPAISVPAGTTPEGWPVGLQLVAAHGQDRRLLEIAAAFESARLAGV